MILIQSIAIWKTVFEVRDKQVYIGALVNMTSMSVHKLIKNESLLSPQINYSTRNIEDETETNLDSKTYSVQ